MELSKINKILANLASPNKDLCKFVEKEVVYDIRGGEQGAEGEYNMIYSVVGEENIYLKINWGTDSYGTSDFIRSVQFVVPGKVVKLTYKSI